MAKVELRPLRQFLAERATDEAKGVLAGSFDVRQVLTLRVEPHRSVVGEMKMIVGHLGPSPYVLPSAVHSIRARVIGPQWVIRLEC